MSVDGVRHAKARRFPVGENPTRQSLQPEAIGAVMEVTKWLKPSISVSRIGDSASVQAATRVNVEQASTICAHVESTVVRFAPRQTTKTARRRSLYWQAR